MFVTYDENTGRILDIVNFKKDKECIEVDYEDVKNLINGIESFSNYKVSYNALTNKMELIANEIIYYKNLNIKQLIYQIPTGDILNDSEITIVQDFKNTCWKFLPSYQLCNKIIDKKIFLNRNLFFSITEEYNPNVLYKSLVVNLQQFIKQKYFILPFSFNFESNKNCNISLYTNKIFESYLYIRNND